MRDYLYRIATDQKNDVPSEILKVFLFILSWLYGMTVKIMVFGYGVKLFSRYILSKPVVSIGNITLGGVGKTPLVESVAGFLMEKKMKPAILLRGYGKGNQGQSDEGMLLSKVLREVAILEGKDKVEMAKKALEHHEVDVFLLDDGFQHWRLKRDLDIVVIDASRPFGNGYLIPRGILREPLDHLRRADIFVLTKSDLGQDKLGYLRDRLLAIKSDALIVETVHEPVFLEDFKDNTKRELSFLQGKIIVTFCAIGDPGSFEYSLKRCGALIKKSFSFMDHHWYTPRDIEGIVHFCQENEVDTVITTQKDAVRLKELLRLFPNGWNLLALHIKLTIIKGKDEFFSRISYLCGL